MTIRGFISKREELCKQFIAKEAVTISEPSALDEPLKLLMEQSFKEGFDVAAKLFSGDK